MLLTGIIRILFEKSLGFVVVYMKHKLVSGKMRILN